MNWVVLSLFRQNRGYNQGFVYMWGGGGGVELHFGIARAILSMTSVTMLKDMINLHGKLYKLLTHNY